ncbi:hypothetical protein FLP41_15295 [Paracoccus marcusii]|uniref:hypothetical protein n=1 Tax=Paracoccus marcusii TaxID=59779 RepID=UPI002ED4FAF3|nr:hypothetical protein FLP41_15295 [Paracoccus marcusii]
MAYGIIAHKIVVGNFLTREATLHDINVTDEGLVKIKPVPLSSLFKPDPVKKPSAKKGGNEMPEDFDDGALSK